MKYKTHLISLKNGASLLAIDVADTKKFYLTHVLGLAGIIQNHQSKS